LYSNFQQKFKGEILKDQLWACARSTTPVEWNTNMDKMKALNADAYAWLERMPPNIWVKAFFSEFPRCDILLNNICEVFNKYILEARELSILSMFEKIKCQLMTRIVNKQKELMEKFQGPLCPKIRKKILKRSEWANLCYVLPAGHGIFQVNEREHQYIVELSTKHCECRIWDLTGIPCNHAIVALRHERIPAESVVPACYCVESFSKAYEFNIWPCKDRREWQQVNGSEVLPPVYEKKVGRPTKSRRKQPHEVQGKYGPKLSKYGVVMHCWYCSSDQHNQATCELKKLGLRPKQPLKRKPMNDMEDTTQNNETTTQTLVSLYLVIPLYLLDHENKITSMFSSFLFVFEEDMQHHIGGSQLMTQLSSTMLSQMTVEVIVELCISLFPAYVYSIDLTIHFRDHNPAGLFRIWDLCPIHNLFRTTYQCQDLVCHLQQQQRLESKLQLEKGNHPKKMCTYWR
jgi:hypothetical protein